MKVRNAVLLSVATTTLSLGIVLAMLPREPATDLGPQQHQPLSRDRIRVVLEGEFSLHHQDCILISIWTKPNESWVQYLQTYECGHGLIPDNPLPPDGGTTLDWEWEEYGAR